MINFTRYGEKKHKNVLLEKKNWNTANNPGINRKEWAKGTCLIVGDSLIHGLDEAHGIKSKRPWFSGATVKDFYIYLVPLLGKNPSV